MKKVDKREKTVEDLQKLFGTESKSLIAGKLGKGATAVSNWVRDGVPDGVWTVAIAIARRETKKVELYPEDQENLDLFMKLNSRGKRALKAEIYRLLAEQERASLEQDKQQIEQT